MSAPLDRLLALLAEDEFAALYVLRSCPLHVAVELVVWYQLGGPRLLDVF